MAANSNLMLLSILALTTMVLAYDPSPLQDFCVANLTSTVRMNGYACIDPAKVEADHFFFSGLDLAAIRPFTTGASVTPVTVDQVPGLNTLGMAVARLDYALKGFIAPHHHTRATEIHIVLEGSIQVGFVTTSPNFVHYSKVVEKGDVFVVPIGLIHYQRNVGDEKAVTIIALNTQNPDTSVIPNGLFGAKPDIDTDYLAKAFALDNKTVKNFKQSSKLLTRSSGVMWCLNLFFFNLVLMFC